MNRKFFIALLGVALFMGAPLSAAVMEYTGSDGVTPVKVKAATPLPITGNVGISGVASVTQAPPTSFVQHDLIASPTAGSFTTSAGCESLMLRTIDKEMWFSLDGIGATVSYGIPLCASSTGYAQQSFSCGPNTTVYFVASVSTEFKAVESIR